MTNKTIEFLRLSKTKKSVNLNNIIKKKNYLKETMWGRIKQYEYE